MFAQFKTQFHCHGEEDLQGWKAALEQPAFESYSSIQLNLPFPPHSVKTPLGFGRGTVVVGLTGSTFEKWRFI